VGDACTYIVRHDDLGSAAEELEGMDMQPDPVGEGLGPASLRVAVVGSA